jgi:hypothetical protein
MADVYIIEQKKGWRMFPEIKQYFDIEEKQVSTYLPHMTNGSPCPAAEIPSACKMVEKENIGGRSATKWEIVNQHGVHVYLWTDDKLEVAVRWHIENVTYDLSGIHEGSFPDSMFELPAGYSKTDCSTPLDSFCLPFDVGTRAMGGQPGCLSAHKGAHLQLFQFEIKDDGQLARDRVPIQFHGLVEQLLCCPQGLFFQLWTGRFEHDWIAH